MRVDAEHRDAALARARQDIGFARKTHERFAVADKDGEVSRLRKRFLHDRRKAGAQRHRIPFAVLEALDAKLLLACRYRWPVHARDRDEGREIGATARQFLRELEAGARRNRVGIDGKVEQPKPVLGPQLFVLSAQIGGLAQLEREAQGIERTTPLLPVGKSSAEDGQAVGFQIAVTCALIRDVGGSRRAIEQQRLLAIIARLDLKDGAGKPQPARRIVGRDRDKLAEDQHA